MAVVVEAQAAVLAVAVLAVVVLAVVAVLVVVVVRAVVVLAVVVAAPAEVGRAGKSNLDEMHCDPEAAHHFASVVRGQKHVARESS